MNSSLPRFPVPLIDRVGSFLPRLRCPRNHHDLPISHPGPTFIKIFLFPFSFPIFRRKTVVESVDLLPGPNSLVQPSCQYISIFTLKSEVSPVIAVNLYKTGKVVSPFVGNHGQTYYLNLPSFSLYPKPLWYSRKRVPKKKSVTAPECRLGTPLLGTRFQLPRQTTKVLPRHTVYPCLLRLEHLCHPFYLNRR